MARRKSSRFVAIPYSVLTSPDYVALTPRAKALLIELLIQYNGRNNGDFTLAISVMRHRNVGNKDSIGAAKRNLLERGIITEVRKGIAKNGVRLCSLFAVNWIAVDEVYFPDGNPKYSLPKTKGPLRTDWRNSIINTN